MAPTRAGPLRCAVRACETLILEEQPVCLEFTNAFRNVFILGTYELEEGNSTASDCPRPSNQTRRGSLQLFSLDKTCSVYESALDCRPPR